MTEQLPRLAEVHQLGRPGGRLDPAPGAPSEDLARIWAQIIARLARSGQDVGPSDVPLYLLAECRRLKPLYEAALVKGSKAAMWAWLKRLRDLRLCQSYPATAAELDGCLSGLWAVCCDAPVVAWSEDSMIRWAQGNAFWPLGATLHDHCGREAARVRTALAKCQILIDVAERPRARAEPETAPDPAAIERVRAKVRDFVAAGIAEREKAVTPYRAVPLDKRHLLVELERLSEAGRSGLDSRIGALRAEIGKAAD